MLDSGVVLSGSDICIIPPPSVPAYALVTVNDVSMLLLSYVDFNNNIPTSALNALTAYTPVAESIVPVHPVCDTTLYTGPAPVTSVPLYFVLNVPVAALKSDTTPALVACTDTCGTDKEPVNNKLSVIWLCRLSVID